jgi:phosphatidylinositol-3-phosphatase
MKLLSLAVASVLTLASTGAAVAAEGPVPFGVPHFDHVFLIMLENHSFQQVIGNPAMPFINSEIKSGQVNVATNYFAVGHPSLTNYLELVGGSNFGVRSDNAPDWHNHSCSPNLATGVISADADFPNSIPAGYKVDSSGSDICPISGVGTDAPTEAVDVWNEGDPPMIALANIDGVKSVPATRNTFGKTIADQLVERGLSWKSYQESLPPIGADGVDNANGTVSSGSDFTALDTLGQNNNSASVPLDAPLGTPSGSSTSVPISSMGGIVNDYAVKHNPFAYFRSVQEGGLRNVVGFDGAGGLYADLATGHLPAFALIAPNQCDDQHGRSNGDAFCQDDPGVAAFAGLTNGTQDGLNPGLAANADATTRRVVTAITSSPAWRQGNNAIVVVWDENDYSGATKFTGTPANATASFTPGELNRVVLTVQTNWSRGGVVSNNFYDSFSVLKSIEGGLGLPCLNHACDSTVKVMSDLFADHGSPGYGWGY